MNPQQQQLPPMFTPQQLQQQSGMFPQQQPLPGTQPVPFVPQQQSQQPHEPEGPYRSAGMNQFSRQHPFISAGLMGGLPLAGLLIQHLMGGEDNPMMDGLLGLSGLGLGASALNKNKKYQQQYGDYQKKKQGSQTPVTQGQGVSAPTQGLAPQMPQQPVTQQQIQQMAPQMGGQPPQIPY